MTFAPRAKELSDVNEAKRVPLCTMAVRNGTVENHSYFQRVGFWMEAFTFPERSFYDVQLLIRWAKIRHASDLRRSLASYLDRP
jgi:hypothetical protein